MSKTMVALLLVCLAAVLLSSGCQQKTAQAGPAVEYAAQPPVACPTVACPVGTAPAAQAATLSTPGADGNKMYVELANPQSDDQGNYVPLKKDTHYPLMGYASSPTPVSQVMVNGVEADTYPADYRPYGTPTGYTTVGFRVPVTMGPDTVMTVAVVDGSGYRETRLFHPNRVRVFARVHQLWQGSQRDPYANVRLANVYAVQGDYVQAYPYYHRSIGLNAGFVWGPFFLGIALANNNRYDDAIWQFRRSRRIYPTFYMANYECGRCYERRGNYAMAISEYRVVTVSQPLFVEAHWSLGESYARTNNWGGAMIEYRTAIQYNPRFAPAHRGMGEVYAHRGQWANATASLNLATNLNPRDRRAYAGLRASNAHRQMSPKQYRVAMAPLKAPRGYEQKAAKSTKEWQGRTANAKQQPGGRQPAQAVKMPGGQQHQRVAAPTKWESQVKKPGAQHVAQPTAWQHQAKPGKATVHQSQGKQSQRQGSGAGQRAQAAKQPSDHQSKQSGGQKAQSSGGHQAKQPDNRQSKQSHGQKDQEDKNH